MEKAEQNTTDGLLAAGGQRVIDDLLRRQTLHLGGLTRGLGTLGVAADRDENVVLVNASQSQ